MRLFGDPTSCVELSGVSVLPEASDPDQRPYIRGGSGTATCAAGRWSVSTWGGARRRLLMAGDRVLVVGTNVETGERFATPVVLACREPGWNARFAMPERGVRRWRVAA